MGRQPVGVPRSLREGACAQVRIIDIATGEDRLVYEADSILEAPNWTPDGRSLCVNGGGRIAFLPLDQPSAALRWIEIEGIDNANNDHLISSDGRMLYLTADGGVYAVPVEGGSPIRLTPMGSIRYYLHGISPDGSLLACTTIDTSDADHRWGIRLVPVTGGAGDVLLSGRAPVDGPEWTPDGRWIWFNGELGATVPGHARLFRVKPDGLDLEQMTSTETVDWFPHFSQDGVHVAYIAYPPGTEGHPPDLPVDLRLMPAEGGPFRVLARLSGGQGTINVNSWAADSRRLAYVAYPDKIVP